MKILITHKAGTGSIDPVLSFSHLSNGQDFPPPHQVLGVFPVYFVLQKQCIGDIIFLTSNGFPSLLIHLPSPKISIISYFSLICNIFYLFTSYW